MKKHPFYIMICLVLVVLITITIIVITKKITGNVVAKVNGYPLDKRLFEIEFANKRSEVIHYFNEKYQKKLNGDLWNESVGGEIPLEKLKKVSLEESTKILVQQILAKEKGVFDDISYSNMLKKLNEENKIRKSKIEKGIPVYGPSQFDEISYFRKVMSDMIYEVKKKIESEMQINDEDMEEFYKINKEKFFKRQDDIKLEAIMIHKGSENENKDIIKNLKKYMSEDKELKNIENELEESKLQVDYDTISIDEKSIGNYIRERPETVNIANRLNIGEISEVFEEGNKYVIIKCIRRIDRGFKVLEEVRDIIKWKLVEGRYNEIVTNMIKNASVEINNKTYNSIKIQ